MAAADIIALSRTRTEEFEKASGHSTEEVLAFLTVHSYIHNITGERHYQVNDGGVMDSGGSILIHLNDGDSFEDIIDRSFNLYLKGNNETLESVHEKIEGRFPTDNYEKNKGE